VAETPRFVGAGREGFPDPEAEHLADQMRADLQRSP
jgi:hypothetical protein